MPAEEQGFTFTSRGALPRQGVNLVARVAGSGGREGVIVVTAHYDHDGVKNGAIYNGADDNASGVAALLALAQALKRRPPVHDVLLVALDAEEPQPGMFGARAFLAAPPVPAERILLNMNLDMVSRQGPQGEIWAAGAARHPALRPVLEAAAAAAPVPLMLGHDGGGPEDDWTFQSDQAPFHEAGIPFVFLSVENHPDYHRPTDDAERVDPAFFDGAAETGVAVLRAFDAAPEAIAAARAAAVPAAPAPAN